MSKPVKWEWLQQEVRGWEQDGLVSHDQARAILARYTPESSGVSWGVILFSCLGAVIVGLGIILLLAYNWDQIPKYAKLGIVMGSVLAAHAVGLRLFARNDRWQSLGEGICLLGTMLFGAGIWLVAQIYHMDEHFPNAFAIWGFGALALSLAMPSLPQAVLASVLLTIWCGSERVAFETVLWPVPLILVACLGSLAYVKRSRLLLAVVIPSVLVSYGFSLPTGGDHGWMLFSALLSLAALCLAASYLVRCYGSFPAASSVLWVYGGAVFMGMLYLLCFPAMAHEFFRWQREAMTAKRLLYAVIPLILTIGAWLTVGRLLLTGKLVKQEGDAGLTLALVPLTVLLAVFNLMVTHHVEGWVVAGPFNLVFIGLTVSMMARGCQQGLLNQTVLGSLLLILLVIARYFDLFESQLIRGLVFVVMGGVLLMEGILYSRAKRQKVQGGAQ